jgi:prepilin-type N-terminal cleavage/methylation domain-containing protein
MISRKVSARGGRKGFTLIELLVVIAIIALLVTMLMPSLKTARDLAKAAVCKAHVRQIGSGLALYATDYDAHLPLSCS